MPAAFRGPAANSRLGELLLDALPLVAAIGFAADVSQHLALCSTTWRRGDRGATNDMPVQSLCLQCGAREAREARREDFEHAADFDMDGWTTSGTTQLTALQSSATCSACGSSSSSAQSWTLSTPASAVQP